MRRIEYFPMELIGSCFYLCDDSVKRAMRQAYFICGQDGCGKVFKAAIAHVKDGHTKSCGCLLGWTGTSSHPLYDTWFTMVRRCTDPRGLSYADYGGRGISVCDEWMDSAYAFYDYITVLPSYNPDKIGNKKGCLTIDREDNDGNYEPGNVRLATRTEQRLNSRPKSCNTSGYVGVSLFKPSGKWASSIMVVGVHIPLGHHVLKKDALERRNNYIIDNNLTEYKIQEWRG